jgi:predicted deacylase
VARAAAPTILGRQVIGRSVDGRPIIAYHLGDPASPITAIIVGQMHGDEPAGVRVTSALLNGPPITGVNLWVVRTMNPDGRAASTRQNAHGVDLNRNWPQRWVPLSGTYYSGPRPLSEPESRAMWRFVHVHPPTFVVSLHQPLDGVDDIGNGPRRRAFRERLAENLRLPVKSFNCWSVCHGSMTDWIDSHQRGAAITVEFPAHPSRFALTHRAPGAIVRAVLGRYRAP